jgi:hypothetical protein
MIFKKHIILIFLLSGLGLNAQQSVQAQDTSIAKNQIFISQDTSIVDTISVLDTIAGPEVDEYDPLLKRDLDEIYVTSPRKFKSNEDYRKYLRYKRYAVVVYPYAQRAIEEFRYLEEESQGLKKSKKKRIAKKKKKKLMKDFKKPLKNLTKTQGYILIKMIEKELDRPFFEVLKELRGSFAAWNWHQIGKLNGYNLKDGYVPGADPILDAVIQDFDISFEDQ